MTKLILYIASSIDGFIARMDHTIDWLENLPNPNNDDYGFNDFFEGIDTVIMGRKTYDKIVGFDVPWPYAACTSYVLTSNVEFKSAIPNVSTLNEINENVLQNIRSTSKKNIWLLGGGGLVSTFLKHQLIDEMQIFYAPVLLGEGIPLFKNGFQELSFKCTGAQTFSNGGILVKYDKEEIDGIL